MKINQINKSSNNLFTTKAEVLSFLKPKLKHSKIEDIFYFTVDEWKNNSKKIQKCAKNCCG